MAEVNRKFNTYESWKPNSPCFKCPDRYVGCHSSCAKYISYLQDLEAKRKLAYEGKQGVECHEYKNYIIGQRQKRKRDKFKHGE